MAGKGRILMTGQIFKLPNGKFQLRGWAFDCLGDPEIPGLSLDEGVELDETGWSIFPASAKLAGWSMEELLDIDEMAH